jgi:hypothetical protein
VRDFDSEPIRSDRVGNTEREFKIAGVPFRFKPAAPAHLLAAYFDATTNTALLEAADALVLAFLEPESREQWERVRHTEQANPVTIRDVQDVVEHMIGVMAGRPTEPRGGSSPSRGKSGTSSTEESDSPEESD